MNTQITEYNFLQGGGEMGELIRATDWSKTPLGDPHTWPQPLKTMVSVMLDNPFGMYIAWGKDYIQIYNDGYRPILGSTKHPNALGKSSSETFSEIWHIIETMFEGVMNGIPIGYPDLMLPLDRHGYIENCYFDFAYSPIRIESGEVGGILVTVVETTDRKKAEKIVKDSNNELEFVIEAAQLGTFDYNPFTNKFTGNDRLKEWFGLPPEEQIDLTNATNAIADKDRERVTNAIKEVLEYSSGGNYDVEYSVINAFTQKETIVHAKGKAWFTEDKVAYRLNGTVEDVTAKVLARKKIEESERNFRLMILQAPVAITIFRGPEYRIEITNKFALEIWDKTEEELINKPLFESSPELLSQGIKEILDDVIKTGNRFDTPERPIQLMRHGVLETIHIKFSFEPLYDALGSINGIMAIGFDITPQVMSRKRVEDSEARYNMMLMQSPFAFLILKGEKMVVHLANDSMIEVLGKGPDILGKELLEIIPEIKRQIFPELLYKVYSSGVPYSANEMGAQLYRNGKLQDVYLNYVYQPYYELDKTISGVTIIAYDVTSSVLAKKDIEISEKRYHNLIHTSPSAIGILSGDDLVITIANETILEVWGKSKDVIGKPYFEVLPELVEQGYKEIFYNVYETGVPYTAIETPVQIVQKGEKVIKYFNFILYPQKDLEGRVDGIGIIATEVTSQALISQEIKKSEQSIRTLIESAPFPIAVYEGEEMLISLANQSIMDIWGKGNNMVGKLFSEILPELLNQKIFDQVRKVLRTGIPFHAKNEKVDLIIDDELKSFYFNYSFTPLYDTSGNVYAVMNTAAEVTELNEAKQKVEKALSETRLFKFMAETAADPFILMDEEGSFIYLNNSALQKWGYTEEEMSHLKVPDVDIIYHEQKYKEAFKRAQSETLPPFETLHKNKAGDIYPVEINMGSVKVEDKILLFAIARDITERKKAEKDVLAAFKKVEESERRFRDSVKQAPLGIAIFRGPDYVCEMANENYLQLAGKKYDQFVGQPLFESLPETKEAVSPLIEDIYKTGDDFYGYEFPISLDRTGKMETYYFNFVYHPLQENNVTTGFMVVATEVTETVKAKQIIEENEEKLKVIIEASELGMWEYNLITGETNVSDRCYEILGFQGQKNLSREELVANFHPDDLSIRQKAIENSFITGILHYELRTVWPDKSMHWIEIKGKIFFNSNNDPERMLGTTRDVTKERNFQQQLLEREEKFRLLADSMPQHIWTSDIDGNLNYFNKSVIDYSGLTLDDLKNDGWLQIVHPDDQKENLRQWKKSIRSGEDFLLEHRFRKYDGEYRWQLSRAIPQKDKNGDIKMWVGTSTDIQEQKMFTSELENQVRQRTNELNQKNIDLEKTNKELQSFVYISSHDLQEPLRKIQTFASLILETEYASLSESAQNLFGRMQASAHRMQHLIQDLFAYSRTNIQDRKCEVIDLNEIIDDIKENLREELEKNNVTLELHNICDVKIIPFQFKQLILNLISNSIKFAKPDEPLRIKIDCAVETGAKFGIDKLSEDVTYCHIQISDNGIGFEPQYSERIFEVFQRLHRREEYEGTGIGLAIVKKIVENHDGIITASGELGRGATFDIYIPA